MTKQKSMQFKQLQYLLYRHAYTDAMYYLGDDDRLKKYTRTFYNNLPNDFKHIAQQQLIESITSTHLTFVGDFHTCRFAQKTFVEILDLYMQQEVSTEVVVALEMFSDKDTHSINSYLKGEIAEEELLAKTNYESTWGFCWDNYKPILDICKKHKLEIYGIDNPLLSFEERENHLAKNIYSILQENPKKKVFCLVGECHLANQHLPKKLQENAHLSKAHPFIKPDFDRILQNIDKYYFMISENADPSKKSYISLGKKQYCVLNTPAWKKWRSVQSWYDNQDYDFDDLDDLDTTVNI